MAQSLPWRALIHFTIAAAATVGFAALAEEVVEGEYDALDRAWALAIHRIDTPALDKVMIAITTLGNGTTLVLVIAAMVGWLLRNNHRRIALILAVNALVAQGLDVLLKHLIARPRPTLFAEIALPSSYSFPSGHALLATAIYGGIAAVLVTLRPWRRSLVIGAAVFLIFSIGFSRVYLGVHWPLDVLAGFAAGVPLLVATVHLLHTEAARDSGRPPTEMNVYSSV